MTNAPIWDDEGWPGLPALAGEVEADVCVVGLGGSGLACVGELLDLGRRVVGVDAGSVGGGAAGRNGGFLLAGLAAFYHDAVAALGRARAAHIYRQTLAELVRIAEETPDAIRITGSLRIADSEEELTDCHAQLAAMRADGLPAEPYDGPEGRGLLIPSDGAFQPLRRCRTLARRALHAGALLFEGTPAVAIEGTTVACPGGRVRARAVVVTVDGALAQVLPELAGRVRATRLQMLATAPTDEVRLPRPVYARWGYDYWQQLPGGALALGGCRDRFEAQEWDAPAVPTPEVQAAMERLLRERVGVQASITHRWAAQVSFHVGQVLPVVAQARPGVWAAGAYNGTGNVIGALCGRGLAQLAARGRSELLDAWQ